MTQHTVGSLTPTSREIEQILNPLPHCVRPSLNAKHSKIPEDKVLLKIKYSLSFVLCLF
jgi:hypothetical protein